MPPAVRRLPRSAHLHIPGHRVVITPSQLRRRPITTREVVRLQNFHDLPARFHPPSVAGTESDSQQAGNYLAVRGEKPWPQNAPSMAARGELTMAVDNRSGC